MRNLFVFIAIVSLVLVSQSGAQAGEEIIVKRDAAERFIVLPNGVRFPEGITADPKSEDIYVATFTSVQTVTNSCDSRKMASLSQSEISVEPRFWGFGLIPQTTRFTSVTSARWLEEHRKFSVSPPISTIPRRLRTLLLFQFW
jgi:hypothetical protein